MIALRVEKLVGGYYSNGYAEMKSGIRAKASSNLYSFPILDLQSYAITNIYFKLLSLGLI